MTKNEFMKTLTDELLKRNVADAADVAEEYEQQFALNYLAGFLLTYRLLPLLKKANGRVIMTGSQSHKGIRVH